MLVVIATRNNAREWQLQNKESFQHDQMITVLNHEVALKFLFIISHKQRTNELSSVLQWLIDPVSDFTV